MPKSSSYGHGAPWGARWRSSRALLVLCTGASLALDVTTSPIFATAIPKRLEALGILDVPSHSGYLMAAYSGGLVVSTPLYAWLGTRYQGMKRLILLATIGLMAAGLLVLLLIPKYWAMLLGRICQGMAGTGLWVISLAMLVEGVSDDWQAKAMSFAMIGYSIGTAVSRMFYLRLCIADLVEQIGFPVGGLLAGSLGWQGPGIFALGMCGLVAILPVVMLDRCRSGSSGPPPAADVADTYNIALNVTQSDLQSPLDSPPTLDEKYGSQLTLIVQDGAANLGQAASPGAATIKAVRYLLLHPCSLTCMSMAILNGILDGGTYNTALALRLYQRYDVSETKAGLVYFAVAMPSAAIAPFSGWLCDRCGPRWVALACAAGFVPALSLLTIESLSLAGFSTILALCGSCYGLINTVSSNSLFGSMSDV